MAGPRRPSAVDVVSDVVCPWCYIGQKRLDKAIAAVPELDVAVRWRPFQLDPTIPPRAWTGGIHARQIRQRGTAARASTPASSRSARPKASPSPSTPSRFRPTRSTRTASSAGPAPPAPTCRTKLVRTPVPALFRGGREHRRPCRAGRGGRARPAWTRAVVETPACRPTPTARRCATEVGDRLAHGHHRRALLPARRQIRGDGRAGRRHARRCVPAGRSENLSVPGEYAHAAAFSASRASWVITTAAP